MQQQLRAATACLSLLFSSHAGVSARMDMAEIDAMDDNDPYKVSRFDHSATAAVG